MHKQILTRRKRLDRVIKKLPGLIAYWPLNDTSGTTVLNHSPSNLRSLNGTISNATLNTSGRLGKAYSFNGTDAKVTITDSASLRGMANVSLLFLLKVPTTSAFRKILKSEAFDVGVNNNGEVFTELVGVTNGNSGTWDNQPVDGIDDNTWRLVILTYDGSRILCYLNNTIVETTASTTGSLNNNASSLTIGNSGTEWYSGLMQHIAVFNRALSSTEIAKLNYLFF